MIFDCFMFSNELEMLNIRLRELYDVVDRFVLVEATHDHKGRPKPLHFADNRSRFQEFADKIRHVIVDDMPLEPTDPWVRENFQRNAVQRGWDGISNGDWIVVSDIDELPRQEALRALPGCKYVLVGFRMTLSYFKVNFLATQTESDYVWSIAYRYGISADPQAVRNSRHSLQQGILQRANPGTVGTIRYGGWHLSYIGDDNFIQNKIRAVLHHEINPERVLDGFEVQRFLEFGADLYGRPGYAWEVVPFTDFFPRTIFANKEAYSSIIAPWGT